MIRMNCCCFFFFNDTATTEIYTLSLHDALPIYAVGAAVGDEEVGAAVAVHVRRRHGGREAARDRKSTRLNSSHANISYAVFCLKKKKENIIPQFPTPPYNLFIPPF